MNKNELIIFFERDLNKLIKEIELYKSEENIWKVDKDVSNSAGNLTLHIIGNLHTFIGKELGKTGYIRKRNLEFDQKNVPKQELINSIKNTIEMIKKSLVAYTKTELREDYPIQKFPEIKTIEAFLVHLANHLTYHLGQINYHRRLIDF